MGRIVDLREVEKDMAVKAIIDNAIEVLAWSEEEQRERLPELLEACAAIKALSTVASRLEARA